MISMETSLEEIKLVLTFEDGCEYGNRAKRTANFKFFGLSEFSGSEKIFL